MYIYNKFLYLIIFSIMEEFLKIPYILYQVITAWNSTDYSNVV